MHMIVFYFHISLRCPLTKKPNCLFGSSAVHFNIRYQIRYLILPGSVALPRHDYFGGPALVLVAGSLAYARFAFVDRPDACVRKNDNTQTPSHLFGSSAIRQRTVRTRGFAPPRRRRFAFLEGLTLVPY